MDNVLHIFKISGVGGVEGGWKERKKKNIYPTPQHVGYKLNLL